MHAHLKLVSPILAQVCNPISVQKKGKRLHFHVVIEFFTVCTKGRNGNFVFKGYNNSKKKLAPVGLDLMLQIITGLEVQCLTK